MNQVIKGEELRESSYCKWDYRYTSVCDCAQGKKVTFAFRTADLYYTTAADKETCDFCSSYVVWIKSPKNKEHVGRLKSNRYKSVDNFTDLELETDAEDFKTSKVLNPEDFRDVFSDV